MGNALKQVLLHVGPSRTGTTAIQSALSAIAEDLQSDGVLFPKTRPVSQEGQPSLAWEILEKVGAPIVRLSKSRVHGRRPSGKQKRAPPTRFSFQARISP